MARFLTEHTSALSQRLMSDTNYSSTDTGIASKDAIDPVEGITSANKSGSSIIDTNGLEVGTEESEIGTTDCNDLSRLISDQGMSGQAIVDSALSWLLNDQPQGFHDFY